eukprot:1165673-Amphidinium_carterae.1
MESYQKSKHECHRTKLHVDQSSFGRTPIGLFVAPPKHPYDVKKRTLGQHQFFRTQIQQSEKASAGLVLNAWEEYDEAKQNCFDKLKAGFASRSGVTRGLRGLGGYSVASVASEACADYIVEKEVSSFK